MAGTLFVVATPIGNLDDISARALRVLSEVSLIAAEDTRRTNHLLQRFGLTTRSTSFHEHNARSKAQSLLERLRAGDSVALVSDAGTPGISDPGQELVRLALDGGIPVVPIPGPSALTAALSVCGLAGSGFVFLGFPPSKGGARNEWFERFRASAAVAPLVVFYEAPHRIVKTMEELGVRFGRLRAFVGREISKLHESLELCYVTDFVSTAPIGEFVVVVELGQMTNLDAPRVGPAASVVFDEFGEMTNIKGLTRRQAIASLSRKYRIPAREVYALVEAGKYSPV